ncbi:MAG: hypothetical protein HQL41_09280 [Alphaproteobacteria bacterium]|nr:hypothetical protein [Alphaproteobacteria bacterium]
MTDRPVAILVPGPPYLFGITGVYYLWELLKSHRVAVVVGHGCANDPLIAEAARWPGVVELVELPSEAGPRPTYHVQCRAVLADLVDRLRPSLLAQHNFVYPWNRYLQAEAAARGLDCRNIVYLNTFGVPAAEDCRPRAIGAIEHVRRATPTSRLQAELMLRHDCALTTVMEQFILPKLAGGYCLPPIFDHMTGEILDPQGTHGVDRHLVYKPVEAEATAAEWPGLRPAITLIRHPVEVVGREVHRTLGAPDERAQIVVLPSCEGYITERRFSMPEERVVREAADMWAAALRLVSAKFPGHPILWKIHPALGDQPIMAALSREIAGRLPNFQIVPHQGGAQHLVLQSRVVVSEASGVLWWASLLGSKTVISLDLFGSNNDLFRRHDGIRYFSTLDDLEAADFGPHAVKVGEGRDALPTLTDILMG